ncbi:hypothetical protein ElyMa_006234300 [Elysia marginata]|uniref:Uncharacterized protein n=1 Tax=Elysia marginata TaxID=1093978 RepID=A0AAV4H6L7_9GAST|nr:hypothetical protein ElyMa_006234300 [Elysia marginata]
MKPTTHKHMKPEEKALQLQKTRTSVKRKAQEITEESVDKMVCQEALKSSLITYQDVKGLKDTFYRERLKLRPKLPTCKEDVLETLMRMDIKDYNFSICKSNKEYGIALLTIEESLLFLSNSHRMLGEGTFKSCPKFFFSTVHAPRIPERTVHAMCVLFIT